MTCPQFMIKAGLLFALAVALLWTVYAFMALNFIYGVLGVLFFAMNVCYVKIAWRRIPFAAINMVTAGTAIKANLGVSVCAIVFTLLELVWMAIWMIAFMGVFEETYNCDGDVCNPNYLYLFLLFLSLFFTQQVLESCVHVTVAGTVGTWVRSSTEATTSCCWLAPSAERMRLLDAGWMDGMLDSFSSRFSFVFPSNFLSVGSAERIRLLLERSVQFLHPNRDDEFRIDLLRVSPGGDHSGPASDRVAGSSLG